MSSDQPTARGDRAQRRIDVMDASASILEESGWAGLNMREVAKRAGVSAGALYQWFAGKDEIYAELYTTRLNEGTAAMNSLPSEMSLAEMLTSVFVWVQTTWNDLGRWQIDFSEISRTREGSETLELLAEAHARLLATALRQLQTWAAKEGLDVGDDPMVIHLIWGTASGLAMRAEVLRFDDVELEALTAQAVRSLIAGFAST